MRRYILATLLIASACTPSEAPQTDDRDGDGVVAAEDCNDHDAAIHPGAVELPYDGLDNDCSTATVDDDLDGDGAVRADDCDDRDPTVGPDATESCDELDNDCNGLIDDDTGDTWYLDADGDGAGVLEHTVRACYQPDGYASAPGDCRDDDPSVRPGATEACDGVDDDCDGRIDENPEDGTLYYPDADLDGFGVEGTPVKACTAPAGFADNTSDCNDTRSDVYPAALERCDDVDNNCDGVADEGADTWWPDFDGDGHGDLLRPTTACFPPFGYVHRGGDCNDADGAVHPEALERCDGQDNDCNTLTDEPAAVDAPRWYLDLDGDGFGRPDASQLACTAPSGHVLDGADCDDDRVWVHPAGTELCNALDDNCDGTVDEDSAADVSPHFADLDHDGYGDGLSVAWACVIPSDRVSNSDDCDDSTSAVKPGAQERCDSQDNDCDGLIDDADPTVDPQSWRTFYRDFDDDGFGAQLVTTQACAPPSGWSDQAGDCEDDDPWVSPAAQEQCDGTDWNCDQDLTWGAEGLDAACPAASCAEVHALNTDAGDGLYWVDLVRGIELVTCDMSTAGGGWTLLLADDFEDDVDDAFHPLDTSSCDGWDSTVLGGHGLANTSDITIQVSTEGVPHTEARLVMDYLAIDSWDWEAGRVDIEGVRAWTGWFSSEFASEDACGELAWDQAASLDLRVDHSQATIDVSVGASLDEDAADESFAVDEVAIWIR